MLVTDRRRLSPAATERDAASRVVELVEAAVEAGVDLIQLRERDMDARALVSLAGRCVAAAQGSHTRILINDRADVALAAAAAGVHLRADSISARAARTLLPEGGRISQSAHNAVEAEAARDDADWLVMGTLFPTPSKSPSQPLMPIEEFTRLCETIVIPVLAIGGMTVERAAAVARAGASGVAAIGLFIPPAGVPARDHVERVTAELRRAFDTCWAVP